MNLLSCFAPSLLKNDLKCLSKLQSFDLFKIFFCWNTIEIHGLTVLKAEVQNQCVGKAMVSLMALVEDPYFAPSAPGYSGHLLAYSPITQYLVSIIPWPFSLCHSFCFYFCKYLFTYVKGRVTELPFIYWCILQMPTWHGQGQGNSETRDSI